ncbi:MAG TPA: hypothetical protein VFG35_16655 [Actinoplanes sp.]|nr:hypothetical protein [Actinoplanes sp.]
MSRSTATWRRVRASTARGADAAQRGGRGVSGQSTMQARGIELGEQRMLLFDGMGSGADQVAVLGRGA